MPFLAALAAGLRRSSIIRAGEGRCCQMCSVLCMPGSSGDPWGEKSKPSLRSYFSGGLRFRGCATESRFSACSPPLPLKTPLPRGTSGNLHHEVCAAETSAGLAALALPCLRAASARLAADAQSGPLPATGQVTAAGEGTFWGFGAVFSRPCKYGRKGSC